MRAPLVLDLETVIDPSVPEDKPRRDRYVQSEGFAHVERGLVLERDASRDFASLSRWRIVSAGAFSFADGFRVLGARPPSAHHHEFLERGEPAVFDERAALSDLASLVPKHTVVGWNSRRFDLPLVCLRALALGVPLPAWYSQRAARYRYSDEAHLDLKDYLSDYGSGAVGGLDQVARLIGFPGKLGVDGASVAALHAEGRFQEIHDYCLADVAQTAAIKVRVDGLVGRLVVDEMCEDARLLLSKIDEEPRLRELAARIDRPRFLCEGS